MTRSRSGEHDETGSIHGRSLQAWPIGIEFFKPLKTATKGHLSHAASGRPLKESAYSSSIVAGDVEVYERGDSALDLTSVRIESDEADAGGGALIYPVLKAGGAERVWSYRARTTAESVDLLDELDRILRDPSTPVGSEVLGSGASRSLYDSKAGKRCRPVYLDVPAARPVLPDAIECGTVRRDPFGFLQACLEVCAGPHCLHVSGEPQHVGEPFVLRASTVEVATDAPAHIDALADVDGRPESVYEMVDARRAGKVVRDPVGNG
jgi:hypothetical protein